jgi:hypothetical protein
MRRQTPVGVVGAARATALGLLAGAFLALVSAGGCFLVPQSLPPEPLPPQGPELHVEADGGEAAMDGAAEAGAPSGTGPEQLLTNAATDGGSTSDF